MINTYLEKILSYSQKKRKFILIIFDAFILFLSFRMALFYILGIESLFEFNKYISLNLIIIFSGIFCYLISGQYIGLTRYIGSRDFNQILIRNFFLAIFIVLISIFYKFEFSYFQFFIAFWILLSGFSIYFRFTLRDLIFKVKISKNKNLTRVVIYGAGNSGARLASYLTQEGNHIIEAFIDDSPQLWNRNIKGIPIISFKEFNNIKSRINKVLLAIPNLNRSKRIQIFSKINQQEIPIFEIPTINDITSSKVQINKLKPIKVEDLLGRDPIPADTNLLKKAIKNKIICVTGAGGSIGSELCSQIIKLNPKKILLLDHSESSLYQIHNKLTNNRNFQFEVIPILGSTYDENFIEYIFQSYSVEIIFHAAAYKHVPLVEENLLQGIYNNVFSTLSICKAAYQVKAKNVIMISSDKAVRPTNVMGATKRLSELIVQSYAKKVKNSELKTCFSMVRFGNVLGSSGSVLPLFQKQIEKGLPLTLTHPDIIRYFMTIYEAAELVIQASALSNGGEVFLLDMGEPIKIKNLAEQLVKLNGLKVKNENNPDGEIEIKCTGLRPGEKLYEELLINSESEPTLHPLIFKGDESFISFDQINPKLEKLRQYIEKQDKKNSLLILKNLIPEWNTDLI